MMGTDKSKCRHSGFCVVLNNLFILTRKHMFLFGSLRKQFWAGVFIPPPRMAVKWSGIFENAREKAVKSIANAQARGIISLCDSTIFARHFFCVG